MTRSRALAGIEVFVFLTACLAAWFMPSAPINPLGIAWFLLGLAILKLSDVWLPRGDAVGMSSALALGALLLFDARVVLVVLSVAELLALLPRGRAEKWRLAIAALAAEAAAVTVCSAALIPLHLHPATGALTMGRQHLTAEQYLYVLAVGLLFAVLEFGLLQAVTAVRDSRPIGSALLGSLSYGAWLTAAQASAGVLAALMYRTMSAWGLVVSVVMILVMRQSLVLLFDIRQAYDSTIDVLIRAMEAQSPRREGLAERTAALSTRVGRTVGLHGDDLERVRYAALLLGVGSGDDSEVAAGQSSQVLGEVTFLKDVQPILRVCDSPNSASGVSRADLTCAYVVMAVGTVFGTVRQEAFDGMKERVSPRIMREVDEALSAALYEADSCSAS